MFVKQIDVNEALRLAQQGVEIKTLVPTGPGTGWEGMEPDTLQNMLADVMFFRDEPAMENPEFERAVQEMVKQDPDENTPPDTDGGTSESSGGTAEPSSKRVGSGTKRKTVDTGKLLALRNAGWSMKKIGEELHVSEATVWNYLKKLEENDGELSERNT